MLEQRVAWLEENVREIRGDIREIRSDVRDIRDRTGRMEERLARIESGFEAIHHRLNALPTVWSFTIALVAAVMGASGLAFAVARLFEP